MALEDPSSDLNPTTIGKAVDALLKYNKSQAKNQKAQLLEHDDFIYLILTLKKIPSKGRTNPYKIPLPSPFHPFDSSEELCLIIDDRSKTKFSLTSEAAKKKVQAENIPVSKVLKFSKLKSDYKPFEAKRKLCTSYDMFFADKRIIPLLPRQLGKEFFKKKKIPIPVDLSHKNWKEQIKGACEAALFYLRTGTCSVIKIGKVSQERNEIVDNVVAAVKGIVEIVPKKWGNVRSLHLKLSESLALPVYQTVPDIGMKIAGVEKREEKMDVDSQGESEKEGEKSRKSMKLKKGKKGRIHEIQYLDNNVDEMLDDVLSDDEDDEINVNALVEVLDKKRKKSESAQMELVLKEVNYEKQLKKTPKLKKGEAAKKKKKNVVASDSNGGEQEMDDEAVGDVSVPSDLKRKKKIKVGKTDSGGIKLKSTKSKRI
ncbi:hypothetical protein IFM89_039090 [Coptis chinensis]|uniref:Ribosomal protein L1 n=1 Tax=Coptis chinensis TaxID=261450 RepID=A0A835IHI5_9MAGN|nr:hypothetical protein IFM89_039090 [Coptis chinensis]